MSEKIKQLKIDGIPQFPLMTEMLANNIFDQLTRIKRFQIVEFINRDIDESRILFYGYPEKLSDFTDQFSQFKLYRWLLVNRKDLQL